MVGLAGVGPNQQFELMGESYKNRYQKSALRGIFASENAPLRDQGDFRKRNRCQGYHN